MKKSSSKNLISTLITGALLVTGNIAMAANDGDLGEQSVGDLTVRAIINPAVQITKLQDIDLNIDIDTAAGTASGRSGTSAACIYNSNGVDYNLKASTAEGSFTLTNSTADSIRYSVRVDDQSGSNFIAQPHGTQVAKTNASNSLDCNGGTNATIQVNANQADVIAAGAGVFSSILVLTVEAI